MRKKEQKSKICEIGRRLRGEGGTRNTAKNSIIIQFLKAKPRNPWDIGEWFGIEASSIFKHQHFYVLNIISQTLAVAVKKEQQQK